MCTYFIQLSHNPMTHIGALTLLKTVKNTPLEEVDISVSAAKQFSPQYNMNFCMWMCALYTRLLTSLPAVLLLYYDLACVCAYVCECRQCLCVRPLFSCWKKPVRCDLLWMSNTASWALSPETCVPLRFFRSVMRTGIKKRKYDIYS